MLIKPLSSEYSRGLGVLPYALINTYFEENPHILKKVWHLPQPLFHPARAAARAMDPPAPAQATPGPSPAAQPLNKQMQQRNLLMPPPKQPSGLPGRGLAKAAGRPRKDWVRDQLGESNDCKHCHKVLSKNITYTAAHLLS